MIKLLSNPLFAISAIAFAMLGLFPVSSAGGFSTNTAPQTVETNHSPYAKPLDCQAAALKRVSLGDYVPKEYWAAMADDARGEIERINSENAVANCVGSLNNRFPREREVVQVKAASKVAQTEYAYGNPAGCGESAPNLSSAEMLANVQAQLPELNLASLRMDSIWNGTLNTTLDVSNDPYVFEFAVDIYQSPYTYLADKTVTVFLENGFVVWLRDYDGHFRLTAVPMINGVYLSNWGEYVQAYWWSGLPNDEYIYPIMKKLPCHWMIDEGWVSNEIVTSFDLDWQIPDYVTNGRKYLASNCEEANKISQEEIGYWDAASMCGPLAWTLLKDANSFPYRIGSWYASDEIFTNANPKWNGMPWAGFDPETYDLIRSATPMPGYNFAKNGNMYKGDVIYSYSTLYASDDDRFDHIFLVTDVDERGRRASITNITQILPEWDCFIREVVLYTPGDRVHGVINKEWSSRVNGRTGLKGFDIFRWKWIAYHLSGQPIEYSARYGDTIETIAFDWKVSPQEIIDANGLAADPQLVPGQTIILPALVDMEN